MIKRIKTHDDSLLAFEAGGTLSEEENEQAIAALRHAIAVHGEINLLVHLKGIPGVEFSAFEDRWNFAREGMERIKRYAIIGDNKMAALVAKIADIFTRTEIRYFESAQEQEAWDWVSSKKPADNAHPHTSIVN